MPTNVLILGGGITGLSAAYHLSRRLPLASSRILLIERSPRLGGWLRSSTVTAEVAAPLEAGPRTLRPTSLAIMELIHLLNLTHSLVIVPKHHPAATARYIHFPPLTLLPSSLRSLLISYLTTPALRGLLPPILREPLRKSQSNPSPASQQYLNVNKGNTVIRSRSPGKEQYDNDESAYSLVSRRFGDRFAREYLSPIVHGIYAADPRSLSVRAAFPFLWEAERRGRGSIVRGLVLNALLNRVAWRKQGPEPERRSPLYEIGRLNDQLKGAAMFTFNQGIETLSRSLFNHLNSPSECPNVDIWQGVAVNRLVPLHHSIHVETTAGKPLPFTPTHVISAIPLPALDDIVNVPPSSESPSGNTLALPAPYTLPHLDAKTNPASTVLVINLVFPASPSSSSSHTVKGSNKSKLLHPDGFGYLVPRPPPSPDGDGYLTQEETDKRARNDMHMFGEVDLSRTILGTIFDSAVCFPGEVESEESGGGGGNRARGRGEGRRTRMTIMLGGPHPLPEIVTSLFSSSPEASASASNTKVLKNGDEAAFKVFLPPLLRTLARTLSSRKNKNQNQNHDDLLAPRAFDKPFELGLPPPLYIQAYYHKECIPTYRPGHLRRMNELREALGFPDTSSSSSSGVEEVPEPKGSLWRGRMHVIGAGVGGVSLGDCVTQGREAAFAIVRQVQEEEHQQQELKRN